MAEYAYGCVKRLAKALAANKVPAEVAERVLEGGEHLVEGDKDSNTEWFRGAMERMDGLLDVATVRAAREACACCLGGKRLKLSQAIARDHETLEARIKAANETPFVFGNNVSMTEDGEVLVGFFPEGVEHHGCPCLRITSEPLPISYCYCCGGHVKHHMQKALGRKLEVTVLQSALASAGKAGCRFSLRIVE